MIGWAMNPWEWEAEQRYVQQPFDATGNIGKNDYVFFPHIRFTESVVLPKPYVTMSKMGIPASGW